MSSLVSHPSRTSPLLGFEATVRILQDLSTQNRLPHALLFSGPRGIGKATLAYHLARALFKGLPLSVPMATDDPLFQRIVSRGHGDFYICEEKYEGHARSLKEIGVVDARQVSYFFSQTSLEGGWRIALLDGIDHMSRQAGNALLKILEEPPAKSLLILISHQTVPLLPTLISRCCLFRFGGHPPEMTEKILNRSSELSSLTQEERQGLALLSEGSPGRAFMLSQIGGQGFYKDFLGLIQALSHGKFSQVFSFVDHYDRLKAEGVDLPVHFILQDFLQNWLAKLIAQQALKLSFVLGSTNPDEPEILEAFMALRSLDQWSKLWTAHSHLFAQARLFHLDARQTLIQALCSLGPSDRRSAS